MKLYIKYMVSRRCIMIVKEILREMELHFIVVDLGQVETMEELNPDQIETLKNALFESGLELMDDKRSILIESIQNVIVDMIYNDVELSSMNYSDYISDKLNHNYTYLSNIFSEVKGTTIQQFIIMHKIEHIKELIIYGELNMTEISYKLNYSSVAHMSNQFKKITGLTPSHFKLLKIKRRTPIEDIGNKKIVNK